MNKFLQEDSSGLTEQEVLQLIEQSINDNNIVTYTGGVIYVNDIKGNVLYALPSTSGTPNYALTCNAQGNLVFNNSLVMNLVQAGTLKIGVNWTFPTGGTIGQVLGLSNNNTPLLQWQNSQQADVAALYLLTQNQSASAGATGFAGNLLVTNSILVNQYPMLFSYGNMNQTQTLTGNGSLINYSDVTPSGLGGNQAFTIGSGTLQHGMFLKFEAFGDVTSSGANTLTVNIQFGSVSIAAHIFSGLSCSVIPFEMETIVRFVQNINGVVNRGYVSSKFNINNTYFSMANNGTIAFDNTQNQLFNPTVSWSGSTSQVINVYQSIMTGSCRLY